MRQSIFYLEYSGSLVNYNVGNYLYIVVIFLFVVYKIFLNEKEKNPRCTNLNTLNHSELLSTMVWCGVFSIPFQKC